MAASYIPTTDSGFAAWLLNFSTLLTLSPTTYGLVAGDATAVAAQNTAFQSAYSTATDPGTRTPAAVAAKDAAKSSALVVVRPLGVQISQNPGVTDENKTAIGVTVRKLVPSPVPTPTALPLVSVLFLQALLASLKVVSADTPTSKAKPFGCVAVQVFCSIGTMAATDPSQLAFVNSFTKIPLTLNFTSADRGKIASVAVRYATRGGIGGVAKVGPFSDIITFNVT